MMNEIARQSIELLAVSWSIALGLSIVAVYLPEEYQRVVMNIIYSRGKHHED